MPLSEKILGTDLNNLLRTEFKNLESVTYLNTAFMGPLPLRAQKNIEVTTKRLSNPSFFGYEWIEYPNIVRSQLASLLHCSANNISHNTSVSEVISTIAPGLDLKAQDTVCLIKEEYPSDVLPWLLAQKKKDYNIAFLPGADLNNPKDFVSKIPASTKVVCLSQVFFQTGFRVDIKNLGKELKEREIFFIVDGTQALGGLNITAEELSNIDIYTAATYKWLLGPYGHAFAYWSDEAISRTERLQASWLSMPQAPQKLTNYTLETKPGASKFDRGQTPNVLGMKGLEGSLSLILEIGLENIDKHNQELTKTFLEQIKNTKYEVLSNSELKSNIVCLKSKNLDATKLQEKLKSANIDASIREGSLRLSFHLFNTEKHIETLIKALDN